MLSYHVNPCVLHPQQESGVLQRDRLRGTVGYMSPELILAGVSSRSTDVWAAGVVLYILLCGRPPFQSKSNRYCPNPNHNQALPN
jgi:serine/threonine protein kinase